MTTMNTTATHSAALDAAAALATSALTAAEARIHALTETLRLMGAVDEMSGDPALTEGEQGVIYNWIPGSAFARFRDALSAVKESLPGLESAVRDACAAVNADVGPFREATPEETGAALGLMGPARIDGLTVLMPR